MCALPCYRYGTQKADEDQHVACNLLGPRETVVEHVAGKKLQEHDNRQPPQGDKSGQVHQPEVKRPGIFLEHGKGAPGIVRALP